MNFMEMNSRNPRGLPRERKLTTRKLWLRITLLLLVCVFGLTSCRTPYPDLTQILEEESIRLEASFPNERKLPHSTEIPKSDEPPVNEVKVDQFMPDDSWKGPVVKWAIPWVSVAKLPDVSSINAYLEKAGAPYRVGLYFFHLAKGDEKISIRYCHELLPYLAEGKIDLLNVGKKSLTGDQLVHELLLKENQLEEIEPKEAFAQPYLLCDGHYYGLGNANIEPSYGLFIEEKLSAILQLEEDSVVNWEWLEQKQKALIAWADNHGEQVLNINYDPRWFVTEVLLPNEHHRLFYLTPQGHVEFFWHAPSFQDYVTATNLLEAQGAIQEENGEPTPMQLCSETGCERLQDGRVKHIDTEQTGFFFPLGRKHQPQNWNICVENVIPRSSQEKEYALDFLYRINEDPKLAETLAYYPELENMTLSDWSAEVMLQGRLYNEFLLPPGQKILADYASEKEQPEWLLWQGFYWDEADFGSELGQIRDFLDSPEGLKLLEPILYRPARAEVERKALRSELEELGVSDLMQQLEADAQAFLREQKGAGNP